MSAKTNAALTTENSNTVVNATAPESITPENLGALIKDIIDSMWNKTDDLLTFPPISLTKSVLATRIGASALNDKQWIQITDRADGIPLFVQSHLTNKIAPVGIWMQGGKACMVVMDYANGKDGENAPFISGWDQNGKLFLTQISGQTNGSIGTILRASATLAFPTGITSVSAQGFSDRTISLVGAADGDEVILGVPSAKVPSDAISYFAFVSAPNVVTVRIVNASVTSYQIGSGVFKVMIIK